MRITFSSTRPAAVIPTDFDVSEEAQAIGRAIQTAAVLARSDRNGEQLALKPEYRRPDKPSNVVFNQLVDYFVPRLRRLPVDTLELYQVRLATDSRTVFDVAQDALKELSLFRSRQILGPKLVQAYWPVVSTDARRQFETAAQQRFDAQMARLTRPGKAMRQWLTGHPKLARVAGKIGISPLPTLAPLPIELQRRWENKPAVPGKPPELDATTIPRYRYHVPGTRRLIFEGREGPLVAPVAIEFSVPEVGPDRRERLVVRRYELTARQKQEGLKRAKALLTAVEKTDTTPRKLGLLYARRRQFIGN